jgi:hypothetical protein
MTWSYDPTAEDNISRVRLLIGDTVQTSPQLQDEEIEFFLSQSNDSPNSAAVMAARSLIARYSRMVDKTIGPLSISYSQRVKGYQELVSQLLRAEDSGGSSPRPFAILREEPTFTVGRKPIG